MADPEKVREQQALESSPREQADIDTERAASFRTTIPELYSKPDAESVTNALRDNETVTHEVTKGSSLQPASNVSVSGLLGRFQYVKTLGQGAFGAVIQVWDPELQTHRAIKVPHRDLIASGKVNADLYISEARKLALMGRNAGIVAVVDVQRMADGTPFVVSEYVSGGNLADRINTGRMPWREAVEFIAKAADAIGHAHSRGVVHRDLKPANILLNEEGQPVVVDFGMALGDDEFSYRPSVCGTYSYMSPQQIRGEADQVDGRSDIYSLGVILYQLLAGRAPYKSRDVSSLKREILQEEPTPVRQYNPAVPSELESICQKAMAKEPKNRYSTAADFSAALRQLLAKSATPTAPQASRLKVNRTEIAIACLGIMALLAAGFFMFERSPSGQPTTSLAGSSPELNLNAMFDAIVIKRVGEGPIPLGPMETDYLPLRLGDQLRFEIAVDEPAYLYIFWIDYDGNVDLKWPAADQLTSQSKVRSFQSPPRSAQNDPQGWVLESRSGPEAVFVGAATHALGAAELQEIESQIRDLPHRLPEGKKLSEFEYPVVDRKTVRVDGNDESVRGAGKTPAPSVDRLTVDHRKLRSWFAAYRGWAFQTQ